MSSQARLRQEAVNQQFNTFAAEVTLRDAFLAPFAKSALDMRYITEAIQAFDKLTGDLRDRTGIDIASRAVHRESLDRSDLGIVTPRLSLHTNTMRKIYDIDEKGNTLHYIVVGAKKLESVDPLTAEVFALEFFNSWLKEPVKLDGYLSQLSLDPQDGENNALLDQAIHELRTAWINEGYTLKRGYSGTLDVTRSRIARNDCAPVVSFD